MEKMTDTLFPKQEIIENVLVALRRIVRSIDLHSRKLVQSHHLTIPQVILLREVNRSGRVSLGSLARQASLSNATVTGIVDRLEKRNLVRRVRCETDRRQIFVEIEPAGRKALKTMPPLLQEHFIRELENLKKWEQAQILSSLERVAAIMDADSEKAAPILVPHVLTANEEDIYDEKTLSLTEKADHVSGKMASSTTDGQAAGDAIQNQGISMHVVRNPEGFPAGIDLPGLVTFFRESLKPYDDTPEDIQRGILDALTAEGREGGFILIAEMKGAVKGALVMQRTGMKGYVPENILLFVAVSPDTRGKGLGRLLVERSIALSKGSIKLHVEYDNPALKLYEKAGFTSKYAEMRYTR
jgi:DNA-binding MarR family transcriptional regulator/GNAT superfamily N-acetyltransferase